MVLTVDTVPGQVLADEAVIDNKSTLPFQSNAKALEKSGETPL